MIQIILLITSEGSLNSQFLKEFGYSDKYLVVQASLLILAGKRAGQGLREKASTASLSPGSDEGVLEAAGPGTSSETAVQKCGS